MKLSSLKSEFSGIVPVEHLEKIASRFAEVRERDLVMLEEKCRSETAEIVASIAHQLRQPLNIVSLTVQAMTESHVRGELTPDEAEETAEQTMAMVRRISLTLEEYRTYLFGNAAGGSRSVRQVVEKVISFVGPELRRWGITVDCEMHDDIVLTHDSNKSGRVIHRLLSCARANLAQCGAGEPRIRVSGYREDESIFLMSADNSLELDGCSTLHRISPLPGTMEPLATASVDLFLLRSAVERQMGGIVTVCGTKSGREVRIKLPIISLK